MADIHALFDDMLKRGEDGAGDFTARPVEYSDECLAQRFTARHEHDLRFVNLWGRWLMWDGRRWRQDETLKAFELARATACEASAEIAEQDGSIKLASAVASAKTSCSPSRLGPTSLRIAFSVTPKRRAISRLLMPWSLSRSTKTMRLGATRRRPGRQPAPVPSAAIPPSA